MFDLTLYWLVPKDRSSRIRWLLRELNVDFSEQQLNASVGEHRAGDYLDVNPFGKVPAIATDNLRLSESGAILLYPLETYDARHNFSPARNSIYWPQFLQWFFWGLATFESAAFSFKNSQGKSEPTKIERFLAPLDQKLAATGYLVGDSFTAADIVCAYDLGILSSTHDFKTYPSIQEYLSRLLSRPAAADCARAIA